MKLSRVAIIIVVEIVLVILFGFHSLAKEVEDIDENTSYKCSTSEEAKYVPTYVYDESGDICLLYNPFTAEMTANLSSLAYSVGKEELEEKLQGEKYGGYTLDANIENLFNFELGSCTIDSGEEHLLSSVNVLVGHKEITYNGKIKCAIIVAFRGTDFKGLDLADVGHDLVFLSNSEGFHSGFAQVSNEFYDKCNSIMIDYHGQCYSLSDIFYEMKNPDSDFCLLVTGHSLGGAVADIFVGYNLYNYGVDPTNVAAYTYAAPKSAAYYYSYPYNNIFNIINDDDLVPKIGIDSILGKQVGTNIYYYPDDEFREETYSGLDIYAKHKIATYKEIVNIFKESPEKFIGYNTENYDCSYINIKRDCFGSFGTIKVDRMVVKNAAVYINGDFNFSSLYTPDEDDFICIGGDFNFDGQLNSGNIYAGTVEIKGDMNFNGVPSFHEESFEAYANFIFCGEERQEIHVEKTDKPEDYTKIARIYMPNVEIRNELFDCRYEEGVEKRITIGIHKDTVIQNSEELKGLSFYLNGNTLQTMNGLDSYIYDNYYDGGIIADGGNVYIGGDFRGNITGLSGESIIHGNYVYGYYFYTSIEMQNGQLLIEGDCECTQIVMNNDQDCIVVEGELKLLYNLNSNKISKGTLKLKGDLYICGNPNYLYETLNLDAKVIFCGDNTQSIRVKPLQDQIKGFTINIPNVEIQNSLFECPYQENVGKSVTLGLLKDTIINNEQELLFYCVYLNGNRLQTKNSLKSLTTIKADEGSIYIGGDFVGSISNISGLNVIEGDMNGDIYLENAQLKVLGNYKGNTFRLNDSTAEIKGDCVCDELRMNNNAGNYLLVEGDLDFPDYWMEEIEAGKIEIKGDLSFSNENTYEAKTFDTNAKFIFSGTKAQSIHVVRYYDEAYSKRYTITLNNVEIRNPLFECPEEEGIEKNVSLGLNSDTVLYHKRTDFVNTFTTNGYKLEFFEIVEQPSSVKAKYGDEVIFEVGATWFNECHWLVSSDGVVWDKIEASDIFSGVDSPQLHVKLSDEELFYKQFKIEIGNVLGDVLESTPVSIIERKTISFIAGSDELLGSGTMEDITVDFDSEYFLPECSFYAPDGYIFDKWEVTIGNNAPIIKNVDDCVIILDNATIKAVWKAKNDIKYTVEHYIESLDGEYLYPQETEILTGTTNESITPQVKEYEGFNGPDLQTDIIKGNGTTIIKYYYSRKEYSLTWELDGGLTSNNYSSGDVKYGATIIAPIVTKDGYEFAGWNNTPPTIMPASNLVFTANWKEIHVHQFDKKDTDEKYLKSAATCTEKALYYCSCRSCGETDYSQTFEFGEELGHQWDEGVITLEATENTEGIRTFTCERCNETYTEAIPKKKHKHNLKHFDAITATCIEAGNSEYWYCDKCGKYFADKNASKQITKDSYIHPAKNHKFDKKNTDAKYLKRAATCKESAVYYFSCSACGEIDYKHTFNSGNALGHKWDSGVITKESTGDEEGVKIFTCERCHETYTEVIPKKETNNHTSLDEPDTPEGQVRAFVKRFYKEVLGRSEENIKEDEKGVADWTSKLLSKEKTGAEVAKGFVNSQEFKNRNVSNEDFVTIMYISFFDRDPDTDGYEGWLKKLNNGTSREDVLAGFTNSQEFINLCAKYGIEPGKLEKTNDNTPAQNNNQPTSQNNQQNNQQTNQPNNQQTIEPLKLDASEVKSDKLDEYVERLYTKILKRPSEEEGKAYWSEVILRGSDSRGIVYDAATAASRGFFNSIEYKNQNTSNEQFVADCYLAFFNRDPRGTEDEVNYWDWVDQLNTGKISRDYMIEKGFGHSIEFKNLLKSYGFKVIE